MIRRVDSVTLVVGLACTWIYVGLLAIDGDRLAGPLTWSFAGVLLAIAAVRVGTRLVRRRHHRTPRDRA